MKQKNEKKKDKDIVLSRTKKKKAKKSIIALIIIDVFVLICFFLTYGPISYFRDFLITTAMTTQSHKYLARIFYNEDTIIKVLQSNTISDFDSGSDTSLIVVGQVDDGHYASAYEKEILEHEKDQDYKLIEFEYNGYDCYLVAIYDPTRVSLMQSTYIGKSGQLLREMAKDNNALVSINAGGFIDADASGIAGTGNGGIPSGIVIKDGKLLYGSGNVKTTIAGFNQEGILVLTYSTAAEAINNGMKDAIQFGPFLVVNGQSATINGNGANKYNWSGRGGASMEDLLVILERYGAYNAVNMDGGASTTLVIENKLWNNPCGYSATGERRLPNGWMFK